MAPPAPLPRQPGTQPSELRPDIPPSSLLLVTAVRLRSKRVPQVLVCPGAPTTRPPCDRILVICGVLKLTKGELGGPSKGKVTDTACGPCRGTRTVVVH